ncbi:MAG: hypothetical protein HQM12_11660 [SAR324 cluster bacterium]|nr:hypothetical protein [SAR324 cluster bacterium]
MGIVFLLLSGKAFALSPGVKIGGVQTAPGVIVKNNVTGASGHIQASADQGGTVGLFFAPDPKAVFGLFIHLDAFTFTADKQAIGDQQTKVTLGSSVAATVVELVPGVSMAMHFMDSSYISLGAGMGARYLDLSGNIYLTEDSQVETCSTGATELNPQIMSANCKRVTVNQILQTTTTVMLADVKLGDFLLQYSVATSNLQGTSKTKEIDKKIGDFQYQVSMTTIKLVYIYMF